MIVAAMKRLPEFALDAELKRFANWTLVWIVMANIGFMALWFSGAPPRIQDILIIGITGIIVKRFPFWFRYTAFFGVVVWSTLNFIGGLFNLSFSSLLYSLRFFAEIKPENSIEYIVAGVAMLFILAIAFHLIRRDTNFSKPALLAGACSMIIGLAGLDLLAGRDMRGHYFRSAPEGTSFGSAVQRTGFAVRADGNRNLVVVMVESLGLPKGNAEMDRLMFLRYKENAAVLARYDLTQGSAPYFNSTTAGEIRELCGRWGDYYDLIDRKDNVCLPARLAKRGYATEAVHSFTGKFFNRADWYPNIGFQRIDFETDLLKDGARKCGGVFAGVCDRDVPALIAKRLKNTKKPTFLYWLTLNSHLPVPPGLNLNVDNCERISKILAAEYPQICRQFAIWNDIDVALVKEITASDFPDTDILIVGDHMPPYFDRHHRTQFDPGRVAWLYLRSKD